MILLYLRLVQSIFVMINVYLDFKELENEQTELRTKQQIFCLSRVMAQIIGLVSHYSYIKLAQITQHWLFFHLHPFFLQISFFTIIIFQNNQDGEQVQIYDTKMSSEYQMMLWLGYTSMLCITSIQMSVSYISTTVTNVINAIIVSQWFIDNFDITAGELNKFNVLSIISMCLGAYNIEYNQKLKIIQNIDKYNQWLQLQNLMY